MTLDWAEYKFPNLFPAASRITFPSIVYGGTTYNARLYSGAWGDRYLGITLDGRIFGLGDFTGGGLQQFGDVSLWAPQVVADKCNVNPDACTAPSAESATLNKVSVGQLHACALAANGGVKCWGWNVDGLLGNGTNVSSNTPVQVDGMNEAISVSAALNHTCALLKTGTIKCWGLSPFGALGDGTTTQRYSPVSVSGINSATSIATGLWHSCAVAEGGSVKCWGYGYDGQLGDGTARDSLIPVTVTGITNAKAVAAGQWHSCALLTDGTVKCWGKWFRGIKSGDDQVYKTPVVMEGISNAASISLGNTHSCVLSGNGSIRCWGDNDFGQLGSAPVPPYNSLAPADVVGISSATVLTAGNQSTCAVLQGGGVQCWGRNAASGFGVDGGAFEGAHTYLPTDLNSLTGSASLGVSQSSTGYICAMRATGGVSCWRGGQWMTSDLQ